MQSIMDLLSLYNYGGYDLTALLQRIPVYLADSLCLSVQGNLAAKAPVQLSRCNGTNAQRWVYDRQRGTISNPPSGKCLDVQWGNPVRGVPVWLWDCNGGDAQRWTYDPETRVLQNALGTVLDIQWGNLQELTPVWTWRRNEGLAQQWKADQRYGRRTPRFPRDTPPNHPIPSFTYAPSRWSEAPGSCS
jgi:Ricin-type beta-trefoil lectin domain